MVPLFLFGIGPVELALILGLVALLFGPWWVPVIARRVGAVVGAAGQSDREFEQGRQGG